LLLEASRRWDSPQTGIFRLLSQYRTLVWGFHQPLVRDMTLPMWPTVGLAAENGFYRGKLPLRAGWTFGGIHKVTSFLELDHVEREMSYAAYYEALGNAFFSSRKGTEFGLRLHLFFGFPNRWDGEQKTRLPR
jgi:hypothetical protein